MNRPDPAPPTPAPPYASAGPVAVRRRVAATAAVVLCFLIVVGAVAVGGLPNDRVAADQDVFHLPVVRQFAAQWPRPDVSDYASATAPGYHLLLAAVERYARPGTAALRAVGGAFGVLLVGLLAYAASARSTWLAMPTAASVYVISSTVWLLPEDAAWLLLTAVLLLATHADGRRLWAGSAVALALLVFVRQSHAWAALPFFAGAWCAWRDASAGRGFDTDAASAGRWATVAWPPEGPAAARRPASPVRFVVITTVAVLPMTLVLAGLVWLWHGLTPPAFRPGSGVELPLATKAGGLAPAAAAMTLALLGLFGTPLLAWLTPAADARRVTRRAVTGCVVGLVAGVLPASTFAPPYRVSGLWNLVQKLPTVADRSLLIVVLSTLGGGVASVALSRLPRRPQAVLTVALAGFVLAQTANASVWQRYYEPFVLIWLTLAAGCCVTPMTPMRRRWAAVGLTALVAFQLAVTAYVLGRGG